ncbi:MAG: C39 family peptidase, partial [Firmicutes bacterium]|nr:C39 family peptidase [Bacillota bacterium]
NAPQYIDPDNNEFKSFLNGLFTGAAAGGGVVLAEEMLTPEEINAELAKYEKATGKQVKYTEKIHPQYATEEEKQKLNELTGVKREEAQEITDTQGRSLTNPRPIEKSLITKYGEPLNQAPQAPKIYGPGGRLVNPEPISTSTLISTSGEPLIKSEKSGQGLSGSGLGSSGRRAFLQSSRETARQYTQKYTSGISQQLKAFANRHPTVTASAIGGGIGAVTGSVAGARGAIIGAVGGSAIPMAIKGTATKAGLRLGALRLGTAALGLSNPVGWALTILTTHTGRKIAKVIIIALLIVFFFPIFYFLDGFLQSEAPLSIIAHSPFFTPSQTASFGGGAFSSSCLFYRSHEGLTYKSSLLMQYFQEAAGRSGVPAVLLAAVARVESPSLVNATDADIQAMVDGASRTNLTDADLASIHCPHSSMDALGIMQIEPPGAPNNSYDAGAVKNGATYADVDFNRLQTDRSYVISVFCNPRDSIMLAAGFIISKMAIHGGDGTHWDPSWIDSQAQIYNVAQSYYGCLGYPCPTYKCCDETAQFNYGEDLWMSIENCRAAPGNFVYYCQGSPQWQTSTFNCPPPNPPVANVGNTGCGPTSLAMILSTFGVEVNPLQVWDVFRQNNWISCDGSAMVAVLTTPAGRDWLGTYGFTVGPDLVTGTPPNGILDAAAARQYIDQGYLIIASSQTFPLLSGNYGHIFVVQNVDPASQTYTLRDPANCSYSTGQEGPPPRSLTQSISMFSPSQLSGGQGWAYAYPIKKVQ